MKSIIKNIISVSYTHLQMLYGQVIDMGIPLGVIFIGTALLNFGLITFIKIKISDSVK